jgi:hypothetical protein
MEHRKMDFAEIQSRLDALVPAMTAKGMRQPSASVGIKSQSEPHVGIHWKSEREARYSGDSAFEYFHGDSLEDAFAKVDAWIADRPSADQQKLNDFLNAVGAAADLGRELGIEAEFVNPLTAMMKRLSENAITFRAA